MNKKNILVYSIMRDNEGFLDTYYKQVKMLVKNNPQYNYFLSVYENDSKDNTFKKLKELDWSFFKDVSLITENLGSKKYGSVIADERVVNLAKARNKAINAKNFLQKSDFILDIESDMFIDDDCFSKLINFQKTHNLKNVDIVSAISWIKKKDSLKLYDTWATRRDNKEEIGNLYPNYQNTPYGKYYSTCNGMCLFKAEPFKKGAAYSGYNDRLQKYDCDTVVICEKFHELGYSDIYIDHTANCFAN